MNWLREKIRVWLGIDELISTRVSQFKTDDLYRKLIHLEDQLQALDLLGESEAIRDPRDGFERVLVRRRYANPNLKFATQEFVTSRCNSGIGRALSETGRICKELAKLGLFEKKGKRYFAVHEGEEFTTKDVDGYISGFRITPEKCDKEFLREVLGLKLKTVSSKSMVDQIIDFASAHDELNLPDSGRCIYLTLETVQKIINENDADLFSGEIKKLARIGPPDYLLGISVDLPMVDRFNVLVVTGREYEFPRLAYPEEQS